MYGYDDDDFTASEVCCICGGGTSYCSTETPTPMPVSQPTPMPTQGVMEDDMPDCIDCSRRLLGRKLLFGFYQCC